MFVVVGCCVLLRHCAHLASPAYAGLCSCAQQQKELLNKVYNLITHPDYIHITHQVSCNGTTHHTSHITHHTSRITPRTRNTQHASITYHTISLTFFILTLPLLLSCPLSRLLSLLSSSFLFCVEFLLDAWLAVVAKEDGSRARTLLSCASFVTLLSENEPFTRCERRGEDNGERERKREGEEEN